ncbi:MAG: hypothetical protein D6822_04660 [Cyanobacteria bacterium J149]|nr:MAG: hypothetical protein D6822_04660 [Cyanobacteria bacterium J149]
MKSRKTEQIFMELLIQLTAETSHFPVTAVSVLIVGFIAAVGIGSIAWYNSNRVVGWKGEGEKPEQNYNKREKSANYDRNITSAETAARIRREGENFKSIPESDASTDTTGGYTVSREGLVNNYAVEPEMYVNQPGDLREKEEAEKVARARELKEVNSDDGDKGVGVV